MYRASPALPPNTGAEEASRKSDRLPASFPSGPYLQQIHNQWQGNHFLSYFKHHFVSKGQTNHESRHQTHQVIHQQVGECRWTAFVWQMALTKSDGYSESLARVVRHCHRRHLRRTHHPILHFAQQRRHRQSQSQPTRQATA